MFKVGENENSLILHFSLLGQQLLECIRVYSISMSWWLLKMQSLWPLTGSTKSETLRIGLNNLGQQPPGNYDTESGLRCLIVFWLIFFSLQPSLVDTFYDYGFFLFICFSALIFLYLLLLKIANSLKLLVGLFAFSAVNIKPCLTF